MEKKDNVVPFERKLSSEEQFKNTLTSKLEALVDGATATWDRYGEAEATVTVAFGALPGQMTFEALEQRVLAIVGQYILIQKRYVDYGTIATSKDSGYTITVLLVDNSEPL